LIQPLSTVYGAATRWRRQWFARDRSRSRRLERPVISVGNLRVGGSGKTPVVAVVAKALVDAGERPAILTRGYARRRPAPGVTVVSDGRRILADVDAAGDEPLMLARTLHGVMVLVGSNRYVSGRFAEKRLDATVHVLDDGFQHLELARDVDLLVVSEEDLTDRPLPSGRLREPLAAAAAADAALVVAGYPAAADRVARALGIATAFHVTRTLGAPRTLGGETVVVPPEARVFAVAAIARPERFFSDVASSGWQVVGELAFRDHHDFTARDLSRIAAAARASAAAIVLTTEKDATRLGGRNLNGLPLAFVPLVTSVEPADRFREWLFARLLARQSQGSGPQAPAPRP
jgi:tetraacyldisaccharide 4'-kinase